MSIVISRHADKRIKERIPGMKSAEKRAELVGKAWTEGIRLGEGNRAEEAYLLDRAASELVYREYAGREGVIYRDFMFIFEGDHLVTVFPRKSEFAKREERIRAKQRRAESKRMAS